MAWRRRPGGPGLPEKLARFVASEWPGECAHEQLRAWKCAALAWLEGNPGRVLPFGKYGDCIDVLREVVRLRRSMPSCPAEYRPAVHWTNGPPADA